MIKSYTVIIVMLFSITACKSKQATDDPSTFPKDVSQRPDRNYNGKSDEEILAIQEASLQNLREEIDSLVGAHNCTDETEWRISPFGSKPCGGPSRYLAYHIDTEEEILPKISEFTKIQAEYNRRKQIFSDCAIEPQPTGLRCEGGEAILNYSNTLQAD